MSSVSDNEARADWPFGPFLTDAIRKSGLSKRRVALAARISEGRRLRRQREARSRQLRSA